MKDKLMSVADAVEMIKNGDEVVICETPLERSPAAIVREMIRSKMSDLSLISVYGGYGSDLLIGADCVRKIEVAYIGFEQLGLASCFRRAVENQLIVIEDYSNVMMFSRLKAGSIGVPFYPVVTSTGSDLIENLTKRGKAEKIKCPFSGEDVILVPALKPDVAIIHAQRADIYGNTQIDGLNWLADDMAKASKKTLVSAEEIVDREVIRHSVEAKIQGATIPGMLVDAVTHAPFGAHPTACYDLYDLDTEHLRAYVETGRDPKNLQAYLQKFVFNTKSHMDYLNLIGVEKLFELRSRARKQI